MDISTKAVWDIVDGTSDLVNVSLKNKYSNGSKMDCILTANKLIRTLAVYMQMMLDADKGVVNYEHGTTKEQLYTATKGAESLQYRRTKGLRKHFCITR